VRNVHLRRGWGVGTPGGWGGRGLTLTSFLSALSFLTIIPAGGKSSPSQRDISNSRAYYPIIGLLLGLLLVAVERGAREVFPEFLTAALLLATLAAATRGLHLDGFMDVCDGLFGGYTPERRLEIMRDSHVGSFAVVGGASLLLLKYGALLSLLTLNTSGAAWALLLFPVLSRWAMVVQMGAFPYVRRQGLGSPFHQGGAGISTVVAGAFTLVAALLLGGAGGVGMLVGLSLLAWVLGLGISRLLGGLTGDTYGAANELVEVVGLMAAVALLPQGWLAPWWVFLGLRL
jgi:adenosylcobinamide-GDP ribazoletransferase